MAASGNTRHMVTMFVFDEKESRREEDLPGALKGLDDQAMLWVALRDPSEEEAAIVQEALDLSDEQRQRLLEQPKQASLADAGEHMHVTACTWPAVRKGNLSFVQSNVSSAATGS